MPTKKSTKIEPVALDLPTLPESGYGEAIPEPPGVKKISSRGSVRIRKSVTKNLGDYNSTQIDIAVKLNLNPTPDEVSEAYKTAEIVNTVVDNILEEQLKAALI